MYQELLALKGNIYDEEKIRKVYGYQQEFIEVIENGLSTSPSKAIYDFLIKKVTHKNGSLIPSRSEKRSRNVQWGTVFRNLKLLNGLRADEKCFAWKVCQDMLPVGARIHRRNTERRCLATLEDGSQCQEIQDLEHAFRSCSTMVESYDLMVTALNRITERNVDFNSLVHLSFNHRRKSKLKCALWFAVKMMYNVFNRKLFNKAQLLQETLKEIDWNLSLNRRLGSEGEMVQLKEILLEIMNV